jgi:hypothetical protein
MRKRRICLFGCWKMFLRVQSCRYACVLEMRRAGPREETGDDRCGAYNHDGTLLCAMVCTKTDSRRDIEEEEEKRRQGQSPWMRNNAPLEGDHRAIADAVCRGSKAPHSFAPSLTVCLSQEYQHCVSTSSSSRSEDGHSQSHIPLSICSADVN